MNKYLEKVAELMSHENKQIAKTFVATAAADLPAAAAGAWVGKRIGQRYHSPSLGTFIGSHVGGGIGTLAAMKMSLHGKVTNNEHNRTA